MKRSFFSVLALTVLLAACSSPQADDAAAREEGEHGDPCRRADQDDNESQPGPEPGGRDFDLCKNQDDGAADHGV